MKRLQYVVTGTGRCGTVYLANLLTQCGLPCGHESIFTPWGLDEARARLEGRSAIHVSAISRESCGDWLPDADALVADSSYLAAPFLGHDILKSAEIIHLVRHPMDVLNSFVVGLNYFHQWVPPDVWHWFIYSHLPELRLDYHPFERAALYYVRWNRMIEQRSAGRRYIRLQVENVPAELFRHLGRRCRDASLLAARKVNGRMAGKPEYTLADVPAGAIRDELCDLGERYGYPMPARRARRRVWRRVWGALRRGA
jgi:hypothetical protein